MSDYTPTTEEVRDYYVNWCNEFDGDADVAEFDRWLAAHDAEALDKAVERVRAVMRHPYAGGEWTTGWVWMPSVVAAVRGDGDQE